MHQAEIQDGVQDGIQDDHLLPIYAMTSLALEMEEL